MLEPIDIARIHRDPFVSDCFEQLRDDLKPREQIKDALFYLALGSIAATTMGLLIMWVQS